MTRTGQRLERLGRVLLALSLLVLSLAHPKAFATPLPVLVSAEYVLPDGTIGEICFGSDGVAGHDPLHESLAPVCDYCRLTASIILPSPPHDGVLFIRVPVSAGAGPDRPIFRVAERRCLPQSRAPPLSV
ncbi:hypothetical protein [Pararhizobium gei]|uniref:hypothetical protein n=1 Tax=Pararhizobium gei TaxID=1395951 RepID=UPI0023DA47D9|nr:hypothetical protein [Rhizobium gei]